MSKEFLGSNIKVKTFDNGGSVLEVGIKAADLRKCVKGEWVNFTISKRQTPSEKGATHYAYVWKPGQQATNCPELQPTADSTARYDGTDRDRQPDAINVESIIF